MCMPILCRFHLGHFMFVGLALLMNGGCGSRIDSRLWEADSLWLYSIDGDPRPDKVQAAAVPGSPPAEEFHGYPVLGKTQIQDRTERDALLTALDRGIHENKGTVAGCFIPRHGIRAVKGPDTIDYVICFQCLQIAVHHNGRQSSMLTTASPQPVFNASLKKANLPLAP